MFNLKAPIKKVGAFGRRPTGRRCKIRQHKYTSPQTLSIKKFPVYRKIPNRPANRIERIAS